MPSTLSFAAWLLNQGRELATLVVTAARCMRAAESKRTARACEYRFGWCVDHEDVHASILIIALRHVSIRL